MSEFQLDAGFLHDHTVNKHTLKKKSGVDVFLFKALLLM